MSKKMTNTQMLEAMMQMMQSMDARISALETPKAEPKARTPKAEPKAETDKVAFTKKDGTVVYVSKKQAEAWERYRSNAKPMTDAQKKRVEAIKASKDAEPKRTRALEKALGLKANSLPNTAVTAEQCRALGWKGTRRELKAIKAQIRK